MFFKKGILIILFTISRRKIKEKMTTKIGRDNSIINVQDKNWKPKLPVSFWNDSFYS